MGITLKEIAELAGVHKSTVDKVLHNRPGVSEAKRVEIKKLLEEYSYESNPLAKALNYQKKKMEIAVVLIRVNASAFIKQGMELVKKDFNSFNIKIRYYETSVSSGREQADLLKKLVEEKISGIVLHAIEDDAVKEAMEEVHEAGIPLITVNSDLATAPKLCYVGQDMEKGGRVAARMLHLMKDGMGRVGIITTAKSQSNRQRELAFSSYLEEIAPELLKGVRLEIEDEAESHVAYDEVRSMLQEHDNLDAIYITCGNVPHICRAVNEYVDAGKMKKPVIICHEKYPQIMELMKTGLVSATINGELTEQGRLAMRLLFEYLIYDSKPEKEIYHVGNEVLLRECL